MVSRARGGGADLWKEHKETSWSFYIFIVAQIMWVCTFAKIQQTLKISPFYLWKLYLNKVD